MISSFPKVFISRDLAEESIFRQSLKAYGCEVIGQSLIDFSPLPFDEVPKSDWLFFYSRNGVRFFFEQGPLGVQWPRIAAMGAGTASALQNLGKSVDFVGSGAPEATAAAFIKIARDQSVLFVQASQSKQSVERLLAEDLKAIAFPVYNNQIKSPINIPVCDLLVFTSPMNVAAYFTHYTLAENQQVIAIGPSTAQALAQRQITPQIAPQPDEQHLAQAVIALLASDGV